MSLFDPVSLSSTAITASMQNLTLFLQTSSSLDVVENLYKIQSVDISRRVASRGRKLFLETYRRIVAQIMDPSNKVSESP